LTAVALISQVSQQIILLNYLSLKRGQLRVIDMTLSWKNDRSEHLSQIALTKINLRSIHGKPVNVRCEQRRGLTN